jgi:ABC-type sugar transport system permease subunit
MTRATAKYSIWKNAFTSLDMGRSAAASFLLLIAILALTVVLVRVMAVGRDV